MQERQAAEAAADNVEQRPLPLERKTPDDFEYGYLEPNRISPGHCTLRQALKFINDHQLDPESWPAKKIANEYKLKEPLVGKPKKKCVLRIPQSNFSLFRKHTALL